MFPLQEESPLPGIYIFIFINICICKNIWISIFINNIYSFQCPPPDGWRTRSKQWSWRTKFGLMPSSTTTGWAGPPILRQEGTPARDRFNILYLYICEILYIPNVYIFNILSFNLHLYNFRIKCSMYPSFAILHIELNCFREEYRPLSGSTLATGQSLMLTCHTLRYF